MKSSAKIFYGLTVFMGIMAVIYILATRNVSDTGSVQGLEWAGATGLALAAGLTLMLGAYFHFTERRIDILPQDWEEAEIEDGAVCWHWHHGLRHRLHGVLVAAAWRCHLDLVGHYAEPAVHHAEGKALNRNVHNVRRSRVVCSGPFLSS